MSVDVDTASVAVDLEESVGNTRCRELLMCGLPHNGIGHLLDVDWARHCGLAVWWNVVVMVLLVYCTKEVRSVGMVGLEWMNG